MGGILQAHLVQEAEQVLLVEAVVHGGQHLQVEQAGIAGQEAGGHNQQAHPLREAPVLAAALASPGGPGLQAVVYSGARPWPDGIAAIMSISKSMNILSMISVSRGPLRIAQGFLSNTQAAWIPLKCARTRKFKESKACLPHCHTGQTSR